MTEGFTRPAFFTLVEGRKAWLPFTAGEYAARLAGLRAGMAEHGLRAALLTSMHNVAYYTGFLYCGFGRPYGCVVTEDRCVTVSANIDGGQPWRRAWCENLVYTDWRRDSFWRAVASLLPGRLSRDAGLGFEADHMSVEMRSRAQSALAVSSWVDVAGTCMRQRLVKSPAEIELIASGARIADRAGEVMRDAIRPGARELDVAMAGRDAMERDIAEAFPEAEYRDTWAWFQSGPNTDGAHNPLTSRRLERGDVLSLNVFPMIGGYYAALERTLFLGAPDRDSRRIWESNVAAHELGLSLIRPGVSCSAICAVLNRHFEESGLLEWRAFGYGHSFGLLSHYYGREAGLELREDVDTVLEPGMVVSMEPMLRVPPAEPGAGGYREHDILVVTEDGARNLTGYPYGPGHNVIDG